jgi:hypothetical protein
MFHRHRVSPFKQGMHLAQHNRSRAAKNQSTKEVCGRHVWRLSHCVHGRSAKNPLGETVRWVMKAYLPGD